MRVPLSWLKDYVPISLPAKEIAHRLTMGGIEVASIEMVGSSWENVYVGQVVKVEPHPNADRLKLATVDLGGQSITVVCGAPNVAQGQKVPFAKVGARLRAPDSPELETLKAARIRGVVSEGMVCSQRELGIGDDHTGIIVLPEDAPLGSPLVDYLGDQILDLEVTANRPDCLSMIGVAYEVAALTGRSVREPELAYLEEGTPIHNQVTVDVRAPELCPRYTASLITGVKVGPSPRWMQDRLVKAGMRPINNVVDITNYVLMEYGQPLHSFDFDLLSGHEILVRRARHGEVMYTLDGQERKLSPSMLVIADGEKAVALAGVMGGANSEMTEDTTRVLLESASFNPISIRRTSQILKARTESSLRFEKGLRPELPPLALRRATQLVLQLAGGKVARGIIDAYSGSEKSAHTIVMTEARARKVLGVSFPLERMQELLTSLGFRCTAQGRDALQVGIPYWRSDISLEEDLVEELARVSGYDSIPTTMLSTPIPHHQPQPLQQLRERVKDLLTSIGMQEVISYSLVSKDALEKVGVLKSGPEPLKVANPMSPEQEHLRTTLRASLLQTLASNQRHEEGPIQLFEAGRVYLPRKHDLPEEREFVAGVLSGPRSTLSWMAEKGGLNLFDGKGMLSTLLEQLGVVVDLIPSQEPFFHPGRSVSILSGDNALGSLGEVHPVMRERFEIKEEAVVFFELDLEALQNALPATGRHLQAIPRYPGAFRDIALLVDDRVSAAQMRPIIEANPLVTSVTLFDVYAGEKVPKGKRSLAYRLLFQAPDRTLTSEEVNHALEEILKALEKDTDAVLR